jgi:hypothetical protein
VQSDAERIRANPEQDRDLDRFEAEDIHHHDGLPVGRSELRQDVLEVETLIDGCSFVGTA